MTNINTKCTDISNLLNVIVVGNSFSPNTKIIKAWNVFRCSKWQLINVLVGIKGMSVMSFSVSMPTVYHGVQDHVHKTGSV